MSETDMHFGLVVHATHEAGIKLGGIGAVLDGLLDTPAYNERVKRTILVGPMNTQDQAEMERLVTARNRLEIRYSSYHGIDVLESGTALRLREIEGQYHVHLLYGVRAFGQARHEVILVDATSIATDRLNAYKGALYRRFGIQSDRYETHPEYSLHVNSAEPGFQALRALAHQIDGPKVVVAHEFMGMPLCYSAMIHAPDEYGTVFYGHEVATARPIVESHPGHDTMFYNVLDRAQRQGRYLEDVFGDQSSFFKHGLISPAATYCDNIFAVGDNVLREMRFLGPDWASTSIDLVYNGLPSYKISLHDKKTSRSRLQRYCRNLLGYAPDYVFTHVTRFIPSKGLWRDIRVMEHVDALLNERRKTAVLFVLSTIIPAGRPSEAVFKMEESYGWPVLHREATVVANGQPVPDLVSHEIPFYRAIEGYNASSSSSKVILINQFGWSRDRCGKRMPEEMSFADIRQGSDLEFGQSIYEPFGIAQLEPLAFGALCVVSSVCGCLGFVRRVGGFGAPNVIVADYTQVNGLGETVEAALAIGQTQRDEIEARQARVVAQQIIDRLPADDPATQSILEQGHALSRRMSWQVVARDYLLPGLQRAMSRSSRLGSGPDPYERT